MTVETAKDKLVAWGEQCFRDPFKHIGFTGIPAADALLNDINGHPHAFVLACIMDRQIKAERAWAIPYLLSQKIGGFAFTDLRRLTLDDFEAHMSKPEPLHRFHKTMSRSLHAAIQTLAADYGGNATQIWRGNPSSGEVVSRFLRFQGVGPKIASMATNILARDFKIPLSDLSGIDISADVHVLRVFSRLGFTKPGTSPEQVILRARELHPAYPGVMDYPVWEIGRSWCHPTDPACADCRVTDVCPTG